MKKVILFVLGIFLIVGCASIKDNPKMKVEEILKKYNSLSDEILIDLDKKMLEANVEENLKDDMKDLYKKQYKDMKYKILNEKIDKDEATVEVEITVYDYLTAKEEATKYVDSHSEEFMVGNVVDDYKIQQYLIEKQEGTEKRRKEKIIFNLHKDNGEWVVDNLNNETILKIHGIYKD